MLNFDPDTHTYTLDGKQVPSVTTILAPLYDFEGISKVVLERKAALGTAVHACTEYDDEGALDIRSVRPEWMPYLQAWRRFRKETGFQIDALEQRVYHAKLGYAGTFDRTGRIKTDRYLLDIKTVSVLCPAVGVQLAAYEAAHRSMTGDMETITRMAVQLRPDGQYRAVTYKSPSDMSCFLGLMSVLRWKESNK